MFETTSEFSSYRRNLPHWQIGGYTYFVTFRALMILPNNSRDIVCKKVRDGHHTTYDLLFGVVMPDHVHLLIRPTKKDTENWHPLPSILQKIKGGTAREINIVEHMSGTLWQKESFDRLIRNEHELLEKWEYIWNNPIKAGLVDSIVEYPFYIRPSVG